MKKLNKTIIKERPINQPFKWHNKTLITKVPKPDMYSECMYCVFSHYCVNHHHTDKGILHCTPSSRSDKLNVYYEEITDNS